MCSAFSSGCRKYVYMECQKVVDLIWNEILSNSKQVFLLHKSFEMKKIKLWFHNWTGSVEINHQTNTKIIIWRAWKNGNPVSRNHASNATTSCGNRPWRNPQQNLYIIIIVRQVEKVTIDRKEDSHRTGNVTFPLFSNVPDIRNYSHKKKGSVVKSSSRPLHLLLLAHLLLHPPDHGILNKIGNHALPKKLRLEIFLVTPTLNNSFFSSKGVPPRSEKGGGLKRRNLRGKEKCPLLPD